MKKELIGFPIKDGNKKNGIYRHGLSLLNVFICRILLDNVFHGSSCEFIAQFVSFVCGVFRFYIVKTTFAVLHILS